MILAVDIGSSSAKGALFTEAGACVGSLVVPLPSGASSGLARGEADSGEWLAALRNISDSLLDGSRDLEAVAISGQGPTFVPADGEGRALHPALTWLDGRAVREAEEAGAVLGFPQDPGFLLPKALWFKGHRPEIYEKTAAFLSCPEYLCRILSGESSTIVPAGYERLYGGEAAFAALGLDSGKFPASAPPGLLLGRVTAAGEEAAGVPRGAKVVSVGPDYLAALIGSAVTRPGRACDRAGSSEGINLCAEAGTDDPRLISVPHIVPPFANVSGMISSTGAAVDWFMGAGGFVGEGYEAFFRLVGGAEAGAGGLIFLPYLAGERSPLWDSSARGAFVGLGLGQGRAEMARAVVEATAFAMRDVIEVMEDCGAPVRELRVTGRPARSEVWNRIKADVTGRPIELPSFEHAELMGDFCFALAALGRAASPQEAAEGIVKFGRRFEPDPSRKDLYDELFGAYREAYRSLKGLFPRLSAAPSA